MSATLSILLMHLISSSDSPDKQFVILLPEAESPIGYPTLFLKVTVFKNTLLSISLEHRR